MLNNRSMHDNHHSGISTSVQYPGIDDYIHTDGFY